MLRAARAAPAPAVLLRADMDALPVTEETGEPFAAPPGVMHACGHDLHTAALVGAAILLSRHRAELAGDVVFMFQPGEEGHDGAAAMIAEGVLDAAGPRVSAAYGLHVFSSTLPRGVFATRRGPLMAASAGLFVTVRGVGGHASRPHAVADPIVVAAEMVIALQTMVTRQFDVFDPVLVTVGMFSGRHPAQRDPRDRHLRGDGAGVQRREHGPAPGTLRAAVHPDRRRARAAGRGVVHRRVPGDRQRRRARRLRPRRWRPTCSAGPRSVRLPDPIMGSEDFSRVLAEVPGAFVFLGACAGDDPATAPTNHSAARPIRRVGAARRGPAAGRAGLAPAGPAQFRP